MRTAPRAQTTAADGPHPLFERGEGKREGRKEDDVGGGTRYAVGPGMGLVADDGEGLGVTRVSAGGADDGGPPRAGSAAAQVPALPPEADRLCSRIDVLMQDAKGVAVHIFGTIGKGARGRRMRWEGMECAEGE